MKLIVLIFMAMVFCIDLSAQKTTLQQKSPDVPTATVVEKKDVGRYEIVISPYLVIKLDTFTGRTSYYCPQAALGDSIQGAKWLVSSAEGFPDESSSVKSKYRIFGQGEVVDGRHYFYLMNTETGQTWVSRSVLFSVDWLPFSIGK